MEIETTREYRQKVLEALEEARKRFSGSNGEFAKKYGLHPSIYSEIVKGKITADTERKIGDARWLAVGRLLGVAASERAWRMARTDVFNMIEQYVDFCKEHSKAMMFVDECAIGKTYSALYLSRNRKNCFYLDATQCRSRRSFILHLARCIGADEGTTEEMEDSIKYALCNIPYPVVIIDEAGALSYAALESLHGLWNGTENLCGWFMMGSDGLRTKLQNGKGRSRKNSFKELFSRFSSKYYSIVPTGKDDRLLFYRRLITDVLSVNVNDMQIVKKVVNMCLDTHGDTLETGLRRAESALILMQEGA